MVILKKKEAFARALKSFGPWNTWNRSQHLAYGLIRGIEYHRMERCCNDNPRALRVEYDLRKLGAWEDVPEPTNSPLQVIPHRCYVEVNDLMVWIKKEPRKNAQKIDELVEESHETT